MLASYFLSTKVCLLLHLIESSNNNVLCLFFSSSFLFDEKYWIKKGRRKEKAYNMKKAFISSQYKISSNFNSISP